MRNQFNGCDDGVCSLDSLVRTMTGWREVRRVVLEIKLSRVTVLVAELRLYSSVPTPPRLSYLIY